jgi:hypothetical protein
MRYRWTGPREHDFEPEGFCNDEDISLFDAEMLVKARHPKAKTSTIRKFLVGLPLHGAITGYAESYLEVFERLDEPQHGLYDGGLDKFTGIPCDFWRIEMAILQDFASGCLTNEVKMTQSELPYRMRRAVGSGELENERVRLWQKATNIHFPKADLIRFAEEPEWQAWGSTATALINRRMNGRPAGWKWDEAKVALTIEASQRPAVLQNLGSIVAFINDQMQMLHHGDFPEKKDVYAYARLFSGLWRAPNPNDTPP